MSVLTKVFVVLATILAVLLVPLMIAYVNNTAHFKTELVEAQAQRQVAATRAQIFMRVRLPASLPSLFSGLKVGVTLSVVGATIGEWVGAKRGLGYLMIQSNALLRIDLVFAAILMLSLLGLLLFGLVRIMEERLLRWRRPRKKRGLLRGRQ